MLTRTLALTICATLCGCVSTLSITSPAPTTLITTIDIPTSKDQAWKRAVAGLAKQFFVINNIDQSSGFINLSYSGDPERFVDCGTVTTGAPGNEITFPGARGTQQYPLFAGLDILRVSRTMTLEGRVNLVFEQIDPSATRVTISSRYILERTDRRFFADGRPQSVDMARASFTGNELGEFPVVRSDGQTLRCRATGTLESTVLRAVQ